MAALTARQAKEQEGSYLGRGGGDSDRRPCRPGDASRLPHGFSPRLTSAARGLLDGPSGAPDGLAEERSTHASWRSVGRRRFKETEHLFERIMARSAQLA